MAHSFGAKIIVEERREELFDSGFLLLNRPPEIFASSANHPVYGKATFALPNSDKGLVAVAGYDSGVCVIYGLDVPEEAVEKRLVELFSIPGTWEKEPVKQISGARWFKYIFPQEDGSTISAETSVREIPGKQKFFMTTVSRLSAIKDK